MSIFHSLSEFNSCHIFFLLLNVKSEVGGTSNDRNNRSWGVSLTGMDFSRVSFFCLYFRDKFFC